MANICLFIGIEVLIAIVAAVLIFKKASCFFKCLYSFIFSSYYIFSKKLWDEHFARSMKFTWYILLLVVASVSNFFILHYCFRG